LVILVFGGGKGKDVFHRRRAAHTGTRKHTHGGGKHRGLDVYKNKSKNKRKRRETGEGRNS
jgi:hypothetical protein